MHDSVRHPKEWVAFKNSTIARDAITLLQSASIGTHLPRATPRQALEALQGSALVRGHARFVSLGLASGGGMVQDGNQRLRNVAEGEQAIIIRVDKRELQSKWILANGLNTGYRGVPVEVRETEPFTVGG